MIWFLVPPSRSIRLVLRLVRFPSYRLADWMRALFLSARFRMSSVGGGAYRFPLLATLICSSRSSSRRLVSWGVSSLFFAVRPSFRLAHQFAGVSLSRLVWRSGFPSYSSFLGVSPCLAHRFSFRVLVSSARLVKQSVFSRFARRIVSAVRGVG